MEGAMLLFLFILLIDSWRLWTLLDMREIGLGGFAWSPDSGPHLSVFLNMTRPMSLPLLFLSKYIQAAPNGRQIVEAAAMRFPRA